MEALLHLSQRLVVTARATSEFLKHTPFLRLPILPAAILKEPIEIFLGFPPALLDRGYEILFVSMAKVSGDVSVLEGLQR